MHVLGDRQFGKSVRAELSRVGSFCGFFPLLKLFSGMNRDFADSISLGTLNRSIRYRRGLNTNALTGSCLIRVAVRAFDYCQRSSSDAYDTIDYILITVSCQVSLPSFNVSHSSYFERHAPHLMIAIQACLSEDKQCLQSQARFAAQPAMQ